MFYYDVVVSICTETSRVDSDLICGGFDTVEDAMDYINSNNVSEEDYYWRCDDGQTAYIEIEVHNDLNGNICDVITVD